jgi:hypothetical protein
VLITAIPPALGTVLDRQLGVASRSQLLAAELTDSTVYDKVRAGTWQLLLPGIFLVNAGSVGTEQRRIAAALYAGDRAQLTGLTVLHYYGFRSAPSTDKVHVLVPHDERRRSTGFVVVQRALRLDESAQDVGVYRVTSPARAVVDAGRGMRSLTDVRAIVTEAVQARHATTSAIAAELRLAGRSRTALTRRALSEAVAGVRSAPEAALRDIMMGSSILPPALWNPTLMTLDGRQLPTPDAYLQDADLAVEVDSRAHHSKDAGWATTLERHNALAELDVQVLHLTPAEIGTVPQRVRRQVERTYLARLASGVRGRVIVIPNQEGHLPTV